METAPPIKTDQANPRKRPSLFRHNSARLAKSMFELIQHLQSLGAGLDEGESADLVDGLSRGGAGGLMSHDHDGDNRGVFARVIVLKHGRNGNPMTAQDSGDLS